MNKIDWEISPGWAYAVGRVGKHICWIGEDRYGYVGKEPEYYDLATSPEAIGHRHLSEFEIVDRRPGKEWTGEGLPPVGTTCEFYSDISRSNWIWRQSLESGMHVDVIAHYSPCGDGDMVAVFAFGDDKTGRSTDQAIACCFRPIPTAEQIEAKKRENAIAEMACIVRSVVGCGVNLADMAALYDAGFRKHDPKPE